MHMAILWKSTCSMRWLTSAHSSDSVISGTSSTSVSKEANACRFCTFLCSGTLNFTSLEYDWTFLHNLTSVGWGLLISASKSINIFLTQLFYSSTPFLTSICSYHISLYFSHMPLSLSSHFKQAISSTFRDNPIITIVFPLMFSW